MELICAPECHIQTNTAHITDSFLSTGYIEILIRVFECLTSFTKRYTIIQKLYYIVTKSMYIMTLLLHCNI